MMGLNHRGSPKKYNKTKDYSKEILQREILISELKYELKKIKEKSSD